MHKNAFVIKMWLSIRPFSSCHQTRSSF